MSKKNFQAYWKSFDDIIKYRWEFLRRNKHYRVDYIKFMKRDYYPGNSRDDYEKFNEKWGFNYIGPIIKDEPDRTYPIHYPDPDDDYNNLSDENKMTLFSPAIDPDYKVEKSLDSVTVRIHLCYPEARILNEITPIIKELKKDRKEKGLESAKRKRLDAYEYFLRVYDLREQRKKFKDIYKILHKHDNGQDSRSYEDKISKAYKRAQELIDHDFRNLW